MHDAEFERLYAEHAAPLFGFLVYRTGDRALAEDLLADTFERVLRSRSRFDPRKGSETTWLYAIALNCARDSGRRRAAERRALSRLDTAGAPGAAAFSEVGERDELRRALGALSSDEREAIALRYGADLSSPQIAAITGMPLTTVEGRVYRGLRKLREQLS